MYSRARRAYGLGIAVALGVLAATIFFGLLYVRGLVREQIAQRDAEALYATMLMEQIDFDELSDQDVLGDDQIGFAAAVRSSRLKGVIGIRFYDTKGVFYDSFPATILPCPLDPDPMRSICDLTPCSRFFRSTLLSDIFIYLPQFSSGPISSVPTLEITVPLHRHDTEKLAGAAQFIIEGASIADEYARLDIRLSQIAIVTFLMSGALLVALLWPAFRHVEVLNADLAVRSDRLQRANDELTLAARISAVGAISSHLMHGLKNPMASLSHFVSSNAEADHEEWHDALTAARRMQSLIEHTLEVLSDARGNPVYEITVGELQDDMEKRVAAAAAESRVELSMQGSRDCELSSRTGNLVGLILVNLLENAIAVTPAKGVVSLRVSLEGDRLCFSVRDQGAGFPEHLRDHIFLPCKSTREGGSGIGLAISKQLADYLDASLELAESLPQGCVWQLKLPFYSSQDSSS
jgi:signal transduction histidine kinase